MESGLFILNAVVMLVAIVMSLRDERAGPEQPKSSYFRYAEAPPAITQEGRNTRRRLSRTRLATRRKTPT